MQALRFRILPGAFLLFPGEPVRQAGHQQKGVRLFDDLIALQAVKADLVVATATGRCWRGFPPPTFRRIQSRRWLPCGLWV